MVSFSRADLESFRDATVPDLLGPGLRLLFVGINPGLWSAATRSHFARAGNRFYPALLRAGIISRPIAPSGGMSEDDHAHLILRGVGITNLVARASARADELSAAELRQGAAGLTRLVGDRKPRVVAILGVTAYRTAFGLPRTQVGRQSTRIAGAELWVVPNPSGLNAHETVESLARAYGEAARAAGIPIRSSCPSLLPSPPG
jgi:double-stranded uracil-DNA glycosylase